MKISKEARKLSKQLYQESFTDGRLDESKVRKIAELLGIRKPRNYIDALKEYQRMIRLEVEKQHAVIESAAELDEPMREQILGTLRTRYSTELTTEFKVSPELIGGVRVKVGSDVWDSSVRGNLDRLESNLTRA